jgi:hypothetical protein
VQSSNFRTEIISKHSRTTSLPIYVAPFKVVFRGFYTVSSATVPQFEAFPEVHCLKHSKCIQQFFFNHDDTIETPLI